MCHPFSLIRLANTNRLITCSSEEGFRMRIPTRCWWKWLAILMHVIYWGAQLESGLSLTPWGALEPEQHLQSLPTSRQEAPAFCTPGSNHWQWLTSAGVGDWGDKQLPQQGGICQVRASLWGRGQLWAISSPRSQQPGSGCASWVKGSILNHGGAKFGLYVCLPTF